MSKIIKNRIAEQEIQMILGTLLRVGVIISSIVIVIGGIIFLSKNSWQHIFFNEFKQQKASSYSLSNIIKGIKHFEGLAIIQLGILLLIFTPIARIVFSIFSFLIERDYQYVLIGSIVLIIIAMSLYLDIVH